MRETDAGAEYRGPAIPARLGEQLRVVLGLDDRPRTFGDWVEAMAYVTDRDGIDVDLDALCTTEDSPHLARFGGETQHYQCAQDAFIVPFLAADVDRVEIETESPVEGASISISVSDDGIEVEPADAVMSFGVAADADPPDGSVSSPILAYSQICPYGNAFSSAAEYDAWADAVDAHAMMVSMEDTLEFAEQVGRVA